MSGWTKIHQSIREELVGKTGVRVLIVEGEEDKAFITSLLDKKNPGGWELRWTVAVAQGKKHALRLLEEEPTWIGLVDRDEWGAKAAEHEEKRLPNLHILPRFCMESYFIQPYEIWQTLPNVQRDKLSDTDTINEDFKNALSEPLQKWLRHGILWHTINPLWEGLRALGFKEKLLKLETAQNDALIKSTLQDWYQYLEPQAIISGFNQKLTSVQSAPEAEQYQWIHGKSFFREHIGATLNQYLDKKAADDWLADLLKTRPLPDDLNPLWLKMKL